MMKIVIYEDSSGYWRWRLRAANGRTFACSGEAFDSRFNAVRAAKRLKAILTKPCALVVQVSWE